MSKELARVKDEIFQKLKDELKLEMKSSREVYERDLRNEIRDLKNEQRNMTESIEFAHREIDDLKKRLDTEIARNTQLLKDNQEVNAKCASLERKNGELENQIVHLEQYSRNANLEIQGVVKTENESIIAILSTIGNAIDEPISECDIEACHRVPTRNPDKTNIIVQFKSRSKRDRTLRKARKARLTNNSLGLNHSSAIYINEHLCPTLKRLLSMAIRRKKDCQWRSVWTHNGKIFARQSDTSNAIAITCEDDLTKIQSV